jgi:hypothetical protein
MDGMAYRDHEEALRSKRDELAKELEALRAAIATSDELEARAKTIEAELAREAKKTSLLDRVRVASPCDADWNEMVGDDRVRFCGKCAKNVFDLSAMARDEAEALVRANEDACVRLARRRDGTVVSGDCPVGAKKKRVRLAVLSGIASAAAACAAALGISELRAAAARHAVPLPFDDHVVEQGKMVAPVPDVPPTEGPAR